MVTLCHHGNTLDGRFALQLSGLKGSHLRSKIFYHVFDVTYLFILNVCMQTHGAL